MIKFHSSFVSHYGALCVVRCAFMFLTLSSYAQTPPPAQEQPATDNSQRQRVEALKIGFLTEKLNLTPDEAKVFWPVYNQYEKEREQLRKSRRENLSNAKMNLDEMSNADVEKAVDNELVLRQSELDLQKKYHAQFKKVLPIKKVARLYKAQEDFKRDLLERIKEKRSENGGRPSKRSFH